MDILKNLNDALEGPEVEFERWYELWEWLGGRGGHGLIASRLDAHKQRNYVTRYSTGTSATGKLQTELRGAP